jgi:hypothetical protein
MTRVSLKSAAIGLVAIMSAVGLGGCIPAPAKPTVLIYGDSLTVLSEPAVSFLSAVSGGKYTVVFRAEGGTAMCDWAGATARDRLTYKPVRVVLAFTGNVDGCVKADYKASKINGVVANYDHSLREIARNYSGIPVTVIASPAMDNLHGASWYPENGNPTINAMYKADSLQLGLRYSTVADDTLTPGHVYTAYRPAYGTKAPLVQVRAGDGVHLTPAGTVYYAEALLN